MGLDPTSKQRRTLDNMIETANHSYNWCLWLYNNDLCIIVKEYTKDDGTTKTFKYPDVVQLNRVVTCQKKTNIPVDHLPKIKRSEKDPVYFGQNNDWFYEGTSSQVKLCAVKEYFISVN